MTDAPVTVVEKYPNVVVVRIKAVRMDEDNFRAVRTEVAAAADEAPNLGLVLDLVNVDFMPSLSVGGLIQLSQLFKARGQHLMLVNLHPNVREVLAVTRVDKLFDIRDDLSTLIGTSFS